MTRKTAPRREGDDGAAMMNEFPEKDAWMGDRKARDLAIRASRARQASGRRRRIDPTTCDRDYSAAEMEFLQAIQRYQQSSGRMFPTWTEVLAVLRGLGYQKLVPGSPSHLPG